MRIADEVSENHTGITPFTFENVTVNASLVQLAFCAWLIRFEFTSEGLSPTTVDFECDVELGLTTSFDFDGIGFGWDNSGQIYSTCLCRSCPLVRNVSTYWFGAKEERADNYWTQGDNAIWSEARIGAAFSWQGLLIQPGESMTVGVVFQTGIYRGRPQLTLYNASDDVNALLVNGTIGDVADGTSCSLFVVIDNDLSRLFLVASDLWESFSVNFSLTDKIVAAGSRGYWLELEFCAVDQTNGRISQGVVIRILMQPTLTTHCFAATDTPGLELAALRYQRVRVGR
jgi:hypothetical protein